jgi:hypothetical protein
LKKELEPKRGEEGDVEERTRTEKTFVENPAKRKS